MIRSFFLSLAILFCSLAAYAQAPQSFSYQAVVRNSSGQLMASQTVSVQISILIGSITGSPVYTETHSATTSSLGLVTLAIGAGTVQSGSFSNIDWGADSYFLQVAIDASGGSNYTVLSTTQLLSVPYALYADKVANADDADADPTNELQTISKINDTIKLSDGGQVTLFDDNAINEIQTISKTDTTISLSKGGGFVSLYDDDPNNELQLLTRVGDTVTLSLFGGSFVDQRNDADASSTNELQTISKIGSTVTLSNGGGSFNDDVNDADADSTNELQTLSRNGLQVIISRGDSIEAPGPFPINYIICLNGIVPGVQGSGATNDSTMTGEIKLFAGQFIPNNWTTCSGQLLMIADYPELYNVLGTYYGGDGVFTFGVPDLRTKVPVQAP